MVVSAGSPVTAADVNLAQQCLVGPSTLGTTDMTATSGTTEKTTGTDTITVPVVTGRVYRISYVFNYVGSVSGDGFLIRIKAGSTSGTQLTYFLADVTLTTAVLTRVGWVEWTASTSGNQTFSTTVQRATGTGTCTGRGAASQPRTLSVEWLGQYA